MTEVKSRSGRDALALKPGIRAAAMVVISPYIKLFNVEVWGVRILI